MDGVRLAEARAMGGVGGTADIRSEDEMRYYLDTEFNGSGGALLSFALLREDGAAIYGIMPLPANVEPWVNENVIPILRDVPQRYRLAIWECADQEFATSLISAFMAGDPEPVVISDWPDDIRYFCELLITGPGQMIALPGIRFEVVRIDAYPTTLRDAVQHNALWDACALHAAIAATGSACPQGRGR